MFKEFILGVFFVGLLVVLSFIFLNIYGIIKTLSDYFLRDFINRYLLFDKIKPEYKSILEQYQDYYKSLNDKNKRLFEKRVQKFIEIKKFIPRGNLNEITPEIKTLIAASAIQVTFGMPGVYFQHFWRILVYEDTYYSKVRDEYHQGAVHKKGLIILSWKNFLKGYIIRNDGKNLGLHEMAHALHLENSILNGEYNYFKDKWKKEFVKISKSEREKIRNGENTIYRKYAATNKYEFFAISIELFFEKPEELKDYDENIYFVLCNLLKQDVIELTQVQ